jgi:hypothetical protein
MREGTFPGGVTFWTAFRCMYSSSCHNEVMHLRCECVLHFRVVQHTWWMPSVTTTHMLVLGCVGHSVACTSSQHD